MLIEFLMWFAFGCGIACIFRLFFIKNQAVSELFAVAYFILATLLAILNRMHP